MVVEEVVPLYRNEEKQALRKPVVHHDMEGGSTQPLTRFVL